MTRKTDRMDVRFNLEEYYGGFTLRHLYGGVRKQPLEAYTD